MHGSWMLRPVMVSASDPFASVPEVNKQHTMLIRPNPSTGEFILDFERGAAPVTAQVVDAMGREVLRSNIVTTRSMDGNDLLPGLYLVRALNADGAVIDQQRLIIAR